jgi:ribonuclease HI
LLATRQPDRAYQQHLADLCRSDSRALWKAYHHSVHIKPPPLVSPGTFADTLRQTFERDHDPGDGPPGFLHPSKTLPAEAAAALAVPISPFEVASVLQDLKSNVACAGIGASWLKEARQRLLFPDVEATADFIVSFDGGKRREQGKKPAVTASAFTIHRGSQPGEEIKMGWAVCSPDASANMMEYLGCIEGLRAAAQLCEEHPGSSFLIRGDSKLVLEQVFGTWRTREPSLHPFHHAACELAESFDKIQAQWRPREYNKRADELCNIAMDTGVGTVGGLWATPSGNDIPEVERGCPRPRAFAFCAPLTALVQRMVNGDAIPADVMAGVACMLPKTQPPTADPAKYRPIVLVNTLCKIFALVVAKRISKVVEAAGLRPDTQFGFRSGLGCGHAQVLLQVCHEAAAARGHQLHVAFIDFSKAYDTISRPLLWRRLKALGIPPGLITAISQYYESDTIQIGPDEEVRPRVGVRQGCPLSPLLFGLFLDGLTEYLAVQCPEDGMSLAPAVQVRDIAYADDFNLLSATAASLQRLLDAVATFARAVGMTVSVGVNGKSTTMVCGAPTVVGTPHASVTYSPSPGVNETLPSVTDTRLLGLSFHHVLGFRDADLRAKDPACKRLWGVLERLSAMGVTHVRTRLAIMRAFVEGWSRYGGDIWGVYKLHQAGTLHAVDHTVAQVLGATLGVRHQGAASARAEVTLAEVAWPTVGMSSLLGAAALFKSMAIGHPRNTTLAATMEVSFRTPGGWVAQLKSRMGHALAASGVSLQMMGSIKGMVDNMAGLKGALPSWFWQEEQATALRRLAACDSLEDHKSDCYFAYLHTPGETPLYLRQWDLPADQVLRLARFRCCDILPDVEGDSVHLLPSTASRDFLATRPCTICEAPSGTTFFHLMAECGDPALVAERRGFLEVLAGAWQGPSDNSMVDPDLCPAEIGQGLRRMYADVSPTRLATLLRRVGRTYATAKALTRE